MRRMGFTLCWPKLSQDECSTLRFTRRDKDWLLGETVLVVYQPRHYNYVLGMAMIISKEPRAVSRAMASADAPLVTEEEAIADGFDNLGGLLQWFWKTGKDRVMKEAVNKLTIRWEYPARTRERLTDLRKALKKAGK